MKSIMILSLLGLTVGCSSPKVATNVSRDFASKSTVNYDDLANPYVDVQYIVEHFKATPLDQEIIPFRQGFGDIENLFAKEQHCVVAIENKPAIEYSENRTGLKEGCASAVQRIEVLVRNDTTQPAQLEVHRSMATANLCVSGKPLKVKDLKKLTHKLLDDERDNLFRKIDGLDHCKGWGIQPK